MRNRSQIDKICEKLADLTLSHVVAIDYSLSPEKKFPYAIEECTHVLNSLLTDPQWINKKIDTFYLCGESAGGNLAVAILLNKKQPIKGLILITPSLDYFSQYESKASYASGYLLDSEVRTWFTKQYLNNDEERKNSLASLLLNQYDFLPYTKSRSKIIA